MTGFDPHLHLRLLGERLLLAGPDQSRRWGDSPLAEAARALVAVGAVGEAEATAIVDDYDLAETLRESPDRRAHRRHLPAANAAPPAVPPPRIVACDWASDQGGGELRVRRVIFDTSATRLYVTWRPPTAGRRPLRHAGHPPTLTVRDDRGASGQAHFSGGGSDHEWTGHFSVGPALAHDTKWLEVDGETLVLGPDLPLLDASVEALDTDADPARRHLWREVQAAVWTRHGPSGSLDSTVEALVAAGALDPDDPAIASAEAVLGAMQGPRPPAASPTIPEPWRSALAGGGRRPGPVGSLDVVSVAPPFDGVTVTLLGLQSDDESWAVEVEVTGAANPRPFSHDPRPTLAWWATDDRGDHYLGRFGNWSSNNERSEGTVNFAPPLNPRATLLRLLPTATEHRAVIEIPLRWEDRGD